MEHFRSRYDRVSQSVNTSSYTVMYFTAKVQKRWPYVSPRSRNLIFKGHIDKGSTRRKIQTLLILCKRVYNLCFATIGGEALLPPKLNNVEQKQNKEK
jgi:hypothetical protein